MVSQALTGTAPGPCGSPEPRPATPPVWGSACQITNCDRRRWTPSRSIMSSCKLGPKILFSHIPIPPLIFIFHFNFQIFSHFMSFLFVSISFHSNRLPLCQRARSQFNSIQSPFRAFYLSTDYTNCSIVVLRSCTVASSMKVLYPAVMCAHRRELVFVHTSLIAVGRRRPSHREDALVLAFSLSQSPST